MSNLNIATIPWLTPSQLRSLLLSSTAQSLAIIDVRDSDYIGGHIRTSIHAPSGTHDTRLPELARTLTDKRIVVFHCMLCQQRGPSAALKYARERERLLKGTKGGGGVLATGEEESSEEQGSKQKVCILQGGFQAWVQSGYGEDERLTEGFIKDLWEDEYD